MGSKAGQQQTSAQVAQASHAANMLADYNQRWLPVQQKLASQIEAEGPENSNARQLAQGKATTDVAMDFDKAQTGLNASLSNNGAAPGSGRADLATAGMGGDAAASKGLGKMISDQQVDDAYTQGLGALTALGQGQSAQVSSNLSSQAAQSGQQASADAQASLMSHEETGGVAGQVAGFGLQQGLKGGFGSLGSSPPPISNTNSVNNPSAYLP